MAVSVKILASAEVEMTEADTEDAVINRETSLDTKIIPLEASFEVTKTADRSVAVPGDKILFQICILKYRRADTAFCSYDRTFSAWKCTGTVFRKRGSRAE